MAKSGNTSWCFLGISAYIKHWDEPRRLLPVCNGIIRDPPCQAPSFSKPVSYSFQFRTLNFILGIWWLRLSLCIFGMTQHDVF